VHGVPGGEPFGYDARLNRNSACLELEDAFDVVYNLVDTPLEGCRDMLMHEGPLSLGCDDVMPILLENSHVSLMCAQPLFSPEYSVDVPNYISKLCDYNVDMGYADNMFNILGGNVENFESVGYLCGYDAALIHIIYT